MTHSPPSVDICGEGSLLTASGIWYRRGHHLCNLERHDRAGPSRLQRAEQAGKAVLQGSWPIFSANSRAQNHDPSVPCCLQVLMLGRRAMPEEAAAQNPPYQPYQR